MNVLLSSRAGISVYGGGVACSASWPLGSIELNEDSLILNALLRSFTLPLQDIESIRFGWLSTQINHHAPAVPSLVRISGFGLSRRLREAIVQNNLPIRIEN